MKIIAIAAAVIFLGISRSSGFTAPSPSHRNPPNAGKEYPSMHHRHEDPELFSVAPMMGHTNRHYRFMFGKVSKRAWLYTEMIPASRLVQSYVQAAASLNACCKYYQRGSNHNHRVLLCLEEIQHRVEFIKLEYRAGTYKIHDPIMEELLDPGPNPAVLQLGGRDPDQLAHAAAIAAAFGFRAVNLNCGCPSTSVSARATGAALMREPSLVAQCLEAMSQTMDKVNPSTILSVKHRLGVADTVSYNAEWDHAQDDEAAYRTCFDFVQRISYASKLSRIQVHGRIALLGFDAPSGTGTNRKEEQLWVPSSDEALSSSTTGQQLSIKINHQRVQYHAKLLSRQVTLQNRSVPPLRPGVADKIAQDFPKLQVISNGGIKCIDEVHTRLSCGVVGAMVGRAAINHPCSFAGVDKEVWRQDDDSSPSPMTRGKVLLDYIDYCQEEESRLEHTLSDKQRAHSTARRRREDFDSIAWHRRRLVAPIFHLFMGEEGNEAYQRRLRKLVSRADRHPTPSMILAAMAEVPSRSLDKPLKEHTPWDQIPKYDFTKRSGAMQRTIY